LPKLHSIRPPSRTWPRFSHSARYANGSCRLDSAMSRETR
jgi:hypothetical protein